MVCPKTGVFAHT